MNTSVLDVVIVVSVALCGGVVPYVIWAQHRLIKQMTQMIAARSLGEWANVQKRLERPERKPEEEGSEW